MGEKLVGGLTRLAFRERTAPDSSELAMLVADRTLFILCSLCLLFFSSSPLDPYLLLQDG